MENVNNLKDIIQANQQSDYLMIIIALFFCIVTSFILMHVYKYKSNSLSSKSQIAPIIPLLSNITFLVILIVKSSLALSLGLVGALSIVRFRTPIKEPEDLVYLFLSIGIGIGFGAFQVISTLLIFFIIIIFIWLRKSNFDTVQNDYNFEIIFKNSDVYKKNIYKINKLLKKNTEHISFVKQEKNETQSINLNLKIRFSEYKQIKLITSDLEKITKENSMQFSIYESKILF